MNDQPVPSPILIGCCTWSYADWEGPFYPPGMPATDYLDYYADRFPMVECDSTFYRPPTARMARSWHDRTPADFRFVLKVPQVITHKKQLQDCQEDVDGFLASIVPLGPKLHSCLLQLGYFNKNAFASLENFLEVLEKFLEGWPTRRVPLSVEIRNPRWMVPAFADVLRRHNTALTLTEQAWMPRPTVVAGQFDPITADFSYVRFLGDRDGIEKITQTWDKIVIDRATELQESAELLKALAQRVPTVVAVSNRYAGYAPETARMLRALLDQPDPVPPPRTRTTLFD